MGEIRSKRCEGVGITLSSVFFGLEGIVNCFDLLSLAENDDLTSLCKVSNSEKRFHAFPTPGVS